MFKLEKLLGIRRGFILSLGLIASPIAAHSCIQSRNAAPQHQSNIIPCASALVSLHGFSCYSHQKQNSAVCSLQQNGPDGQCSEWITCIGFGRHFTSEKEAMCCASLPRLSTPPIQFPSQIRISHLNNCSSVQRIFKLHGCNRVQQLNDDVISDHELQVLCSNLARLKNLLLKKILVNRA